MMRIVYVIERLVREQGRRQWLALEQSMTHSLAERIAHAASLKERVPHRVMPKVSVL